MGTPSSKSRGSEPTAAGVLNRAAHRLSEYWFPIMIALLLLWVGLPWLAPVSMKLGWQGPAETIYSLYSFQCHQLPQRSFFLFGEKSMYSLAEIKAVWPSGSDPLALRQFIGNETMGYKVAWSDRMVAAYGGIPLAALAWWPLRRRLRPFSIAGMILLTLPMVVDASTHMLSDMAGLGQGFRYSNEWLAALIGHSLPASFYKGNALGSFNSWLRLLTGTLFAVGLTFFALPHLGATYEAQADAIRTKFERAGRPL